MSWRKLIPVVLIVAVIIYLVSALPESFSTDLSRIGSAPLTVVAVHDINLVASTEMMGILDGVKGDYGDQVLILVADVNNRQGRAFSSEHEARPATLVLFDSDREKVDTISGELDEVLVERRIDRALSRD